MQLIDSKPVKAAEAPPTGCDGRPRGGIGRGLRAVLRIVTPSAATSAFVLVGWIAEWAMLPLRSDSILTVDSLAAWQVPLLLLLAWMLAGWSLWLAAWFWGRLTARLPLGFRKVSFGFWGLVLALGLSVYAASWVFYLRTGRFLTVDAVEFALVNSGEGWLLFYVLKSETLPLVLFGMAAAVSAVFGVVCAEWLRRDLEASRAVVPVPFSSAEKGTGSTTDRTDSRAKPPLVVVPVPFSSAEKGTGSTTDCTDSRAKPPLVEVPVPFSSKLAVVLARILVWCLIWGALIATSRQRMRQSTFRMSEQWQASVQRGLNPLATVLFGSLAGAGGERIEPVLDGSELVPLDAAAWQPAVPAKHGPSVIFLAVESLRHDIVGLTHQGLEVMPNLNRLAQAGVHFPRAYTQSTHSDYADPCLVSSLYPLRSPRHHYYSRNDPWPKTLIWDLLSPAGYATAIISAQNEKWGGMDKFLETPGLDLYYDAERSQLGMPVDVRDSGFAQEIQAGRLSGGSLLDSHVMDVAIAWIGSRVAEGKPYFLSMNLQSSHFPYSIPADLPRPFQPSAIDFDASFSYYPPEKAPVVRNAYYNALQEVDRQLGRLVEALRQLGQLDDTLLMVMGENGQAFHENGVVSHAGVPVEPVVRVALVMHAPQRLPPRVDEYPVELIDLPPTVLGLIGQPPHPNFQGIDVFASPRPAIEDRVLYFHTENPLCRSDALLYQGRWKLIHDRERGISVLFDVVADPGESNNLIDRHPELARRLRSTLTRWRQRQLAYYHFPFYYLSHYPPQPPRVDD
jgi:arylsulfatase A-like enzyme